MPASWLGTWKYRLPLAIPDSLIDAALSDFPILLRLSSASGVTAFDFTAVFDELTSNDNRTKIAVTTSDGTTECKVEIQAWDDAGELAVLWVKVPAVAADADTVLYLYYDVSHADNDTNVGDKLSAPALAVWDANFVSVHHLNEAANGTAGEYKDSTSNGNHGQGGGGTAAKVPTCVDGAIGKCQRLDGAATNGDYIHIPDHDGLSIVTAGALTVEFMMALGQTDNANAPQYTPIIGKCQLDHPGENKCEWQFHLYNLSFETRPQWLSYYVNDPYMTYGSGSNHQPAIDDIYMGVGDWHHVCGAAWMTTATAGTQKIWLDNSYAGQNSTWDHPQGAADYDLQMYNTSGAVRIGNYTGTYSRCLKGDLCEFRVSNIVRSDAWRAATNLSNKDALVTYSSIEQKAQAEYHGRKVCAGG